MEASDDRPEPIVPSDNTTLLAVLDESRAAGFGGDFWVSDGGRLRCGECRQESLPTEVELHALHRLEGASDPSDMLAVMALECPSCGSRGTAVVNYGPEATEDEGAVLLAVDDRRPRP